jgi:uncharacterized membrane protein
MLFWLLAAGVLVLTAWTFADLRHDANRWRARLLAALRGLSAILLAAVLVQPQCQRREFVAERPLITVFIDDSQSMNDGPSPDTRAMVAREWLDSAAFRLAGEACELRYFSIGSNLSETIPGAITFKATESRINAALADWSRRWGREGAAGVVLISDGLDTGGGPPAKLDLPCWVMEVEPPSNAAAARITAWQVEPPRRPMAGAETSVRVVLQGWGAEGKDIPIELWSEGRKVAERRVRFTSHGDVVEVLLPLKPERPGTYAYELRVADPAADAAAQSQPFVIAVRQEGRSVLLLSNTLGFESKFLRRALTTDRNVRLDSFTRWQDGRWASFGDSSGAGKDSLDLGTAALSSFSAIVLADVAADALNPAQWEAIAGFADKGGGLVVLGGPHLLGTARAATSLGRILPVPTPAPHRDGRFGVKLTDAGLRHPVFGPLFEAVKDFPALQGANLATGVAGNAQVLMEAIADGQARPLVVVKHQGAGRVAVILSDTLWRWRVGSPGWSGRLSPYDTFWAQMLDWLAPDQEGLQSGGRIEVTADRPFYRQNDKAAIQAEWIGKGPPPFEKLNGSIRSPSGETRPLVLSAAVWKNPDGRRVNGFRAEVETESTGIYQVETHVTWDGGEARSEMSFAVAASPEERRGEGPDAGLLMEIAKQSGGRYFARGEGEKWLEILPKPKRQIERVVVTDIWNHPLIVVLLLGCLCGEWWLRRRSGLA